MNVQQPVKGTVVPTLRYRDVPAAIAWLCTAFGFEKQMAVVSEDGLSGASIETTSVFQISPRTDLRGAHRH